MPQFMKDSDRIVGGQRAPSMIPWQVAIVGIGCGGTILDSCTILSAAHCFDKWGVGNQPPASENLGVRAGSLLNYSGGQVRGISKVIWNSEYPYNQQTYNNDWVILKLDKPLNLNEEVQPACLPFSSNYAPENYHSASRCFTMGYGRLSQGNRISSVV